MIDALRQDYVRTLRSRGLSHEPGRLQARAAQRRRPGARVLAVQFVGLLGGAVIVEQIFAIPGLGQVAVSRDQPGRHPAW